MLQLILTKIFSIDLKNHRNSAPPIKTALAFSILRSFIDCLTSKGYGDIKCCGKKDGSGPMSTYNANNRDCCNDGSLAPIGNCFNGGGY